MEILSFITNVLQHIVPNVHQHLLMGLFPGGSSLASPTVFSSICSERIFVDKRHRFLWA